MKLRMKKRGVQLLLLIVGYLAGWKIGIVLKSSLWGKPFHTIRARSLSQSLHVHPRESERATLHTVVIGVMTSWENLLPRASAILDTWGQEVADQILFYVGHDGHETADVRNRTGSDDTSVAPGSEPINIIHGIPVVELSDVADVNSPPCQKSIAMLRHMHQHFGRHSRWFVRAEDDVYIHYQNLTHFLLSLNDSLPWYLGPSVMETRKRGQHQRLTENHPFCQERPGIAFSATSLRLLLPHLLQCRASALTSREDRELGRCVLLHLNLSYSTDQKVQALFLQTISDQRPKQSFIKNEASSVTSASMKEGQFMWDVHHAVQLLQLRHEESRQQKLEEELKGMDPTTVDPGEFSGRVTADGGTPGDQGNPNNGDTLSRAVKTGKRAVAMETEDNRGARMDTEKSSGREVGEETEDNRGARMDTEKSSGREVGEETEDNRGARMDTEKSSGREVGEETEDNRGARMDTEKSSGREVGEETEDNRGARMDTEKSSGREVGEETVWRRVQPGRRSFTFQGVAEQAMLHLSKVSPQFRRRLTESFKHSSFQNLPPSERLVQMLVHRAIKNQSKFMMYWKRSVKDGLQYLVSVSTSKGLQSFRIQSPLGELAWREDFHHGISVPSDGILMYSAFQRQFEKNDNVRFKPHQKFGYNLINSPPEILKPSLPTLHILLPLKGRHQRFLQFLENLDKATGMYGGDVHLHVALFQESDEETELSSYITERKSGLSSSVFVLQGKFQRTLALNTLSVLFDNSSILVLMDVDMELTDQFLYRVAFNVGPNTAYAPIVFSTYSPDTVCYGQPRCSPSPFDFSNDSGLWRDFGYGMIALRAEDYRKCGGMDNRIIGWGNEDVDFMNRCIREGIIIIRSRDPGLTHVYHDKVCDPHLPKAQLRPCCGSKWALYGSTGRLAQMVMDMEENGTL